MYLADENRYDGRMPVRRAGNSGLQLPAVSFGMWHNFGDDATMLIVKRFCLKRLIVAFSVMILHTTTAQNPEPLSSCLVRSIKQI